MQTIIPAPLRALRCVKVAEKTGLSKTHIYRLISQGKFPKPTHLSERVSVWFEHDIDAWLADKFAA
ncbi:MAG: AlpA family phage regulatory protein [Methylotenera sp.]|uniref:helix-turn-helix transcriptional regulator n=1 Tax=Methylotenera sp. TaxID=2051956 RepID=UPI002486FEE6|nr:AlpA family phage regulatory protein [Methylotenera sp.]MDI1309397.1 AlpA family phage regulatory protein [Methylotenera sp.]